MIYFVNPVKNPNVGDIAIFYNTSSLLRKLQLEYKIVNQLNYKNINVTSHDKVIICGGGWLGIYDDALIEFFYNMIEKYSKITKVILLPSSFAPIKKSFTRIKDCNCVIFARDMQSYKLYKEHFKNSTVHYCHDMAFLWPFLDYRKDLTILTHDDIGIYDRNDAETVGDIKTLSHLGNHESRLNSFIDCDYNLENSFKYICKQLFTMSKYKLIITDTLHMSIFAFLLNLPCLILDNSYKKLSNTWKEYSKTPIQMYDFAKKLNVNLYTFGDNKTQKFDYSVLINYLKN